MNTTANFSISFGQASKLKVDKPDRSQPLQRMATRISLFGGALDFMILGLELRWILAAATMLCAFLSPLECRAGVSPLVLQDFADWEKEHRGSWIQVTDYDSAAKCFRMTPAVYNEEFAAMAVGYVDSAPNILMWLVFTPSGSFLYRSDQGVIPLVNPEPFPATAYPPTVEPRTERNPANAVAPEIFTQKPPANPAPE
jgi:hypothetical protein